MEEYQNELSQNKDKLEELQKLQNNGTITDAQKTEIDNLKYQNALLEEKLQKLKDINEQETKNQAHDAADRFNTEFNEGNDKSQSTNANDVIERVKKTYSNTSPDGKSTGINWNAALNGNENDVGVQQLAKIKLATDEYNQAVHDLVNGVNDVTEEDVENYKYTLDTLTENFEGNKEKLYNDLTDGIKKMEAVKGTDAFDQETYDNMQSWLEIFKNYVPEYKEAMKKVQEEANSNPIEQKVTYSEDFQTLNDSLSSLTEHAELLSKVNKEISESGRISAENLKKINEAFPEDKYPELTKSLYEYQLGLISTTELFDKLEECYNSDVESYKQKNQEEIKSSEYFWNKVITGNEELQVALTNFYGEDWKKWTNLEQAKAQSEQKLIENLGGMWAKYFENQLAAFKLTKDA